MSYGLGTENKGLPGFVVLNGGQIPSGGLDNFASGLLPAVHQGSLLNAIGKPLVNVPSNETIPNIQPVKRKLVKNLNQTGLDRFGNIDVIESAIKNHELAARMQTAIPDLMEINRETPDALCLYGIDSPNKHTATYARQCVIARRMVERGVRFVELTIPLTNGYQRWDAHSNLRENYNRNALAVNQPVAALVMDLKRRGLLDETLIVWGNEFGRTPFAQGANGRDHNEYGFTMWLSRWWH